jgi:hypothetical protein
MNAQVVSTSKPILKKAEIPPKSLVNGIAMHYSKIQCYLANDDDEGAMPYLFGLLGLLQKSFKYVKQEDPELCEALGELYTYFMENRKKAYCWGFDDKKYWEWFDNLNLLIYCVAQLLVLLRAYENEDTLKVFNLAELVPNDSRGNDEDDE